MGLVGLTIPIGGKFKWVVYSDLGFNLSTGFLLTCHGSLNSFLHSRHW